MLNLARLATLAAFLGSTPALADAPEVAVASEAPGIKSPYDRPFAFGTYATGWAGAYGGAGLGGRLRWEGLRYLGIDVFGEALLVQTPHGVRHDHPVGFNVFLPLRLSEAVRLRPLVGMCTVFSFIEPTQANALRADDVLFGLHLGLEAEVALGRYFSLFADGKGVAWAGHDRAVQGWTGAVSNSVKPFVVAQTVVGVSAHFGPLW